MMVTYGRMMKAITPQIIAMPTRNSHCQGALELWLMSNPTNAAIAPTITKAAILAANLRDMSSSVLFCVPPGLSCSCSFAEASSLPSPQVNSGQRRPTHALCSPGAYLPLSFHYTPEFDRQCMSGIAGIVPSIKRNFKSLRERFCPQELDSWRAAFATGLLNHTRFRQHALLETKLGRLAHSQIDARHGAKLAPQTNLAQQHGLWRELPLAK